MHSSGIAAQSRRQRGRSISLSALRRDAISTSCQIIPLGEKTTYIFIEKTAFRPDPALFLAVVRFEEGSAPGLFLNSVMGRRWDGPFVRGRPYTDQHKSPPEWGLTLSGEKMGILRNKWSFRETVARL